MNRKAMLGLVCILAMTLLPSLAAAEWQNMEPVVVGGTLSARHGMTFIQVAEDKVMMFGGRETYSNNETWIYDVSDDRWTKQTNINYSGGSLGTTAYASYAPIGGDKVLMMGGWRAGTAYRSGTWLYDYSQNKWTNLNPTINGEGWVTRGKAAMAYLGDDKVLMFGGYRYNVSFNDTWIYDLSENSWTLVSPTVTGGDLTIRNSHMMASVGEGKVIAFGGNGLLNETWLYDQTENSWALLSPTIVGGALKGRHSHGLVNIGGDRLLMFGGTVASGYKGDNDLWMYDLSDNTWTMLETEGKVPPQRGYLGMTAVGPGKVVLFGGNNNAYNSNYGDTWVFNIPESAPSTFTAVADSSGVSLNWSQDAGISGSAFYVYKNNKPLSEAIITGTEDSGRTIFSYSDSDVTSGTLIRYKLLEVNSELNSQTFSKEITVPYCN